MNANTITLPPSVDTTPAAMRNVWSAAKTGNLDLLRALVEQDGHSFQDRDIEDKIPFYYACTCAHVYVLQYLDGLYTANQISIPDDQRILCIQRTVAEDIWFYLKGQTTIDYVVERRERRDREATMTIWDAAKEGNLTKLRHVLKFMPEQVTARDESDHTALFYACQFANPAAVAVLLAPFRKAAVDADAAVEEFACRGVASDTVLQVLDGTITIKDIMMQEKAKNPKATKA
ncbi:Aste57867_1658 [Aphanomyces stellatus]|uniref:Aste57867_1658 protein n=1 Tax=Aphanomyces stellatus TaxID=120398 RepID=A0A485K6S6_9STRA|nr:hypothetical protein As57867_001656 [Aphanomyces stellatus]VFT78870.1 Aste57867_1658 [Aphanomyces stellatus]